MNGDGSDDGLGDSGANSFTLADARLERLDLPTTIQEGATLERLERSAQNLTGVEVVTLELAILKNNNVLGARLVSHDNTQKRGRFTSNEYLKGMGCAKV